MGLDEFELVVVGAHMSGLPLNHQLDGSRFVGVVATAPVYRLYALPNTTPPKPGLVRVADGGVSIAAEVYALDAAAFGRFVAGVPSPLCIGSVELDDGRTAHGFLCESVAVADARDVSEFGGWRGYLESRSTTAS